MSAASRLVPDPTPHPEGDVFVRPFRPDGAALADPYAIFENPEAARSRAADIAIPQDVPQGYIPVHSNLVVDKGRQIIANLIGGRDYSDVTPVTNWIITQVSFGVGDTIPRFTDTTLSPQPDVALGIAGGENEIEVSAAVFKKAIFSVDWPQPYIVRFEVLLLPEEGNGYLVREMGLWSGNGTLFARKVIPAISKTGDLGLSWLWRIRC